MKGMRGINTESVTFNEVMKKDLLYFQYALVQL